MLDIKYESEYNEKEKTTIQQIVMSINKLIQIHLHAVFEKKEYPDYTIIFTANRDHTELRKYKALGLTWNVKSLIYFPRQASSFLLSGYAGVIAHEMCHFYLQQYYNKKDANNLLHYALNADLTFSFSVYLYNSKIKVKMADIVKFLPTAKEILEKVKNGTAPQGIYDYWSVRKNRSRVMHG